MRRAALCLAAAIGVLSAGLVPSGLAQEVGGGGQSGLIGVDDGVVTIDVPIQFAAPLALSYDDGQAFLAKLEADVEKFLNDALANLSFDDCYQFRVDVRTSLRDGGFDQLGEWVEAHHIWLNLDAGLRSMTYTASETGVASLDDPGAWEFYSTGEWAYHNMTPRDYAHEVMHLFGLGDDYRPAYDADGNFDHAIDRPGREGSLMDSGELLDQDLVDRLGKLLRQAEELPLCWVADLSVHSFRDYNPLGDPVIGPQTCDDDWTAKFTILVDSDGAVSGDGEATLAGGPACTFDLGVQSATEAEFDVGGTASPESFELVFSLTYIEPPGDFAGFQASLFGLTGAGPPVVVLVTGAGTAEGEVHLSGDIAGTPITADGTITMTCRTCAAAPVG